MALQVPAKQNASSNTRPAAVAACKQKNCGPLPEQQLAAMAVDAARKHASSNDERDSCSICGLVVKKLAGHAHGGCGDGGGVGHDDEHRERGG